MDWPRDLGLPLRGPNISPFSPVGPFVGVGPVGAIGAAAWPTANLAIFIPVRLGDFISIVRAWLFNGATVSGNFDIGLYDATGVRLVSTGSTVQSGVSTIQSVTVSWSLVPSLYYLALAFDNVTATVSRASDLTAEELRVCGLVQMATAFPLPATATFAAVANAFIPVVGLSLRTTP